MEVKSIGGAAIVAVEMVVAKDLRELVGFSMRS